jgi:hypothetical protein
MIVLVRLKVRSVQGFEVCLLPQPSMLGCSGAPDFGRNWRKKPEWS